MIAMFMMMRNGMTAKKLMMCYTHGVIAMIRLIQKGVCYNFDDMLCLW